MNTLKAKVGKTKMIAHRGCSCVETENTMPAFVAAGNRSYYGIETDVHFTSDGKYIIMHDFNTERVSGQSVQIEDNTFDTLRGVRINDIDGTKGRPDLFLPSLAEYIGVCKRYGKVAVLEIKWKFTVEQMDEVMDIIGDYADHTIIISFFYEALESLRVHHKDQPAMFLCGGIDDNWLDRLQKDNVGLDIGYPAMNEELLAKCKARGIAVNVWTVDTVEDAERFAAMGVDYNTSNTDEAEELAAKY